MSKKEKAALSTNVLEMKFMRRTKQRLEEKEKQKNEAELQKAYLSGEASARSNSDNSECNGPSSEMYVFTRDFEFLEDLQFGRMSFKGYNPQVERLMKYYHNKKNGIEEEESDNEKDIDDDEMAETLGGSLSGTIAGKFRNKAEKARKETLIDESAGDRMGPKKRSQQSHENNDESDGQRPFKQRRK